MPNAHSKLSLSSAKRWMNCPGSIRLIAQAPESEPSIYAAEGTAAHSALESKLQMYLAELRGEPEAGGSYLPHDIGFEHEVDGFKFTTDTEMLEAIDVAFDYVVERMDFYKLRPFQVRAEERLKIPGHDDLWGTSDIRIYIPYNRLIVVDYKHGKGVKVDAFENEQLMAYAVGAYNSLPKDEQAEIQTIEIVVIQPRSFGGSPISSFEFPVSTLQNFHVAIVEAAVRTENPNAPVAAGEWCRFCPAKLFCRAYENLAKEQAALDFANVPALSTSGNNIELPDFIDMPVEKLAKILEAKGAIEKYLDAAEAHAQKLAKQGVDIPGHKLVKSSGNRKWKNEIEVQESMQKLLGVNEAFAPKKVLSPAQFEKTIKKVYPEGILEERIPSYDTVINNMYSPDKGFVLVPESDKRPAANPQQQALADFQNA